MIFTGSTEVARLIHRQLATRDDDPVLIAETGGQNAMIVDSSALPEQVVADALSSAFDSAGQRCSALRVLCLQDDVAPEMLAMLEGALAELAVGDPRRLATDVGPVIDAEARAALVAHVARMRAAGLRVVEMPLPPECARGTFVAPTIVDLGGIGGLAQLTREVFGPVLHVLRWKRDELPALVDAINATGYGLTHGIHTRIDETVAAISRARARRQRLRQPQHRRRRRRRAAVRRARAVGHRARRPAGRSTCGGSCAARRRRCPAAPVALPGPTGEANTLELHPRGVVACIAADERGLVAQVKAALAHGNTVLLLRDPVSRARRQEHRRRADRVCRCARSRRHRRGAARRGPATTRAACAACSPRRPAGSCRSSFPTRAESTTGRGSSSSAR